MNHTPGPWKANCLQVVASDNSQICHTGGTRYRGQQPQPDEAVANATLIAAAPNLLAACKAFVAGRPTEEPPKLTTIAHSNWEMFEQARAAIEKATS